jgi:hypothetical protein
MLFLFNIYSQRNALEVNKALEDALGEAKEKVISFHLYLLASWRMDKNLTWMISRHPRHPL